jgi:hypothetical protein
MIYLIDDKKPRQEALGWNEFKFEKFNSIIKTIYSYKQIKEENLNTVDKIYSDDSIILFHESFFDHVDNSHKKDSIEIRNELISWYNDNNIPLVQFSGSNKSRNVSGNTVSIPVKIVYQNLELFVISITRNDNIEKSMKILLFGENYNIEQILQLKKELWETKFRVSPLLNSKIKEFNTLTNKNIDLKIYQDPTIIKSLINE